MSGLKALAKPPPPPFNTKSFWGALVSQDLNSKAVYGICFSSLTWEVSAGRVDGRAVGELGMPACLPGALRCLQGSVCSLPALGGVRGSKGKTPWPIYASSESGRLLRAVRAVLCMRCLGSTRGAAELICSLSRFAPASPGD